MRRGREHPALPRARAGAASPPPPHVLDHRTVPAACFTHPEIAFVGLSEEAARREAEAGGWAAALAVAKTYFKANTKALAEDEADGLGKLIYRRDTGEILGCHLYGLHSADLIHEFSNAMAQGQTIQDLYYNVHAHPTVAEVVEELIRHAKVDTPGGSAFRGRVQHRALGRQAQEEEGAGAGARQLGWCWSPLRERVRYVVDYTLGSCLVGSHPHIKTLSPPLVSNNELLLRKENNILCHSEIQHIFRHGAPPSYCSTPSDDIL
ncbi:hypothetical protein QBZ16_000245 [Prototheca wickerhamii]|uniref:Pyridine nucleotide-disulphide oxidoreductase dimerisation domain-containing protein n=1 Tax=Prototheca wickerhamii TaxID=3111 RepID=A0AAD9IP90_PROWI|nr:hypothetical protein QBZ16_000245 [Prototheca wickerhamii]